MVSIGSDFHGTFVNKHAKFLMLSYAFENLNMKRVELKTDFLNERSRKAILKLGCKEEGVLRSHLKVSETRWRDSIYYSILDSEWLIYIYNILFNITIIIFFKISTIGQI